MPHWRSDRAFATHMGYRGSISGRDGPTSLKRVVTVLLSVEHTSKLVDLHRKWVRLQIRENSLVERISPNKYRKVLNLNFSKEKKIMFNVDILRNIAKRTGFGGSI